MTIFQSIVLGLVQGITEALPISSSGHLILTRFFLGWADAGLSFDIALHFGTLLAIFLYFYKEWKIIFLDFLNFCLRKKSKTTDLPENLWLLLVVATIPGALAGFFLNDLAENAFRQPLLVAGSLCFFGFLLYLVDKKYSTRKRLRKINFKNALLIGLAQALAIIPGTSRSGITITAGRALGFNRSDAARFSFLMSAPIILGASLYELPKFLAGGFDFSQLIGIVVAALSGLMSIHWLLKFVQKTSYAVFFWYRLALALLIVAVWVLN